MSQESLKFPPEHTINRELLLQLRKNVDTARACLANSEKEFRQAEQTLNDARKNWIKACQALPSVIEHTDTKIFELVEKP